MRAGAQIGLTHLSNKKAQDMYRATTYSRSEELPSALEGFTSVFGMETGGAPPTSSPYTYLELKLIRGMLLCLVKHITCALICGH